MAEDRDALPVHHCENGAMRKSGIMMRKGNSQMTDIIAVIRYVKCQDQPDH